MSDKRVRIGLNVSPKMNAILEELKVSLGASSKGEVIRRAVALLHVTNKAVKEGKRVGVAEALGGGLVVEFSTDEDLG